MNAYVSANLHPVADDYIGGDDGSIALDPSSAFVSSAAVQDITDRAMAYLEAGYAVHFSGPAGTGKTTLAFHAAAQLGRPTILLHGDHEFGSSDLIGRESGYSKSRVVDNYIGSVLKFQEEGRALWIDNRITTACRLGHTIIYDEFNRSKPEANNPFLSILSEGVLNVPGLHGRGEGYVNVHPNFRAIFTSNPTEYAGVYNTQDALLDRMITLRLNHYDRDTEIAITASKSSLDHERAARVVDLVRLCRSRRPGSTVSHPARLDRDRAGPVVARGRGERTKPGLRMGLPGYSEPEVAARKQRRRCLARLHRSPVAAFRIGGRRRCRGAIKGARGSSRDISVKRRKMTMSAQRRP